MSSINLKRWSRLAGLLTENVDSLDPYEMDGMDEYGNPLPSGNFNDFGNSHQTTDLDEDEISEQELEAAVEEAITLAEEEFGSDVEEIDDEEILSVFFELNPVDYIYDQSGKEIIDIDASGNPLYADGTIVEGVGAVFTVSSLIKALFSGKLAAPTLGFIALGGSGQVQRIIDMINDKKKARSARKIPGEATTAMKGTSSGGGGAAGQVAVKNHIVSCLLAQGVPEAEIDIGTAGIGSHIPDVLVRPSTIQWIINNKNSLTPAGKAAAAKLGPMRTTGIAFEVKSDQGTVDYPAVSGHQNSKYDFTTLPKNDPGAKAHKAAIVTKLSTPDSHGTITYPADAYYIITDPLFVKLGIVKMANYDRSVDMLFLGHNFNSIGYAGMADTYINTVDGRPRRGGYVASTPKFSKLKTPWKKITTLGDTSLAIEQMIKDQHYGTKADGTMSAMQETGRKIVEVIQSTTFQKSKWNGFWGDWTDLDYDQYVNCVATTTPLGDVAGGNFTAQGGDKGILRIARGSLDKVYTNPSGQRKEYMFDVFVDYWPQAIKNALESELIRWNQRNPGQELLPKTAAEKAAALDFIKTQICPRKGWNPKWFQSVGDDVYRNAYSKVKLPESYDRYIDDAINNWKQMIRG
jgi:hypothetical protein